MKTAERIPAIETRYNQHHFRSRGEARWAVLFDVVGIPWHYEPEKYDVGDGEPYIPDFWLPTFGLQDVATLTTPGAFFEVKGPDPTEDEIWKAWRVSELTSKESFIFWGSGFNTGYETSHWYQLRKLLPESSPQIMEFHQCAFCGKISLGWDGHVCRESLDLAKKYNILSYFNQDLKCPASPLIQLAIEAAKSARFESPEWREEIKGILLAAQRMREQGVYCAPETTTKIHEMARQWADGGGGPYDEPWYDKHWDNLTARRGCDCGHCRSERRSKANQAG